ncbi:MAG: DUF488 family protein [Pseudomonadota bacterium]
MPLRVKRTYETPIKADGSRVLVERLWPRGMTKEAVAVEAWLKEVAPSTELRRWFAHRPERWEEFRRRYGRELDARPDLWRPLLEASKKKTVTLLFSAHDPTRNSAVALHDYLTEKRRLER